MGFAGSTWNHFMRSSIVIAVIYLYFHRIQKAVWVLKMVQKRPGFSGVGVTLEKSENTEKN